jgi:hypothetical protein
MRTWGNSPQIWGCFRDLRWFKMRKGRIHWKERDSRWSTDGFHHEEHRLKYQIWRSYRVFRDFTRKIWGFADLEHGDSMWFDQVWSCLARPRRLKVVTSAGHQTLQRITESLCHRPSKYHQTMIFSTKIRSKTRSMVNLRYLSKLLTWLVHSTMWGPPVVSWFRFARVTSSL